MGGREGGATAAREGRDAQPGLDANVPDGAPPPGRRPAPATPTERGDGDYTGSASSLARQNAPREPNRGQDRESVIPDAKPERAGLRGVEDK